MRLCVISAPKIVSMTGATPGLGKTSVSDASRPRSKPRGQTVELFAEDDILERQEFADVVANFRSPGVASIDQLLDASNRYVKSALASDTDVFVPDTLFPFLPSLLAWEHSDDEIRSFFAALAECCEAVELVQVHIAGEADESLRRAADREGDGWLEQFTGKVGRVRRHRGSGVRRRLSCSLSRQRRPSERALACVRTLAGRDDRQRPRPRIGGDPSHRRARTR